MSFSIGKTQASSRRPPLRPRIKNSLRARLPFSRIPAYAIRLSARFPRTSPGGNLGRVLFSQDSDLLAEATLRQQAGTDFAGVIYAPQLAMTIGRTVHDLELIAKVYEPADMVNRVEFLPLR